MNSHVAGQPGPAVTSPPEWPRRRATRRRWLWVVSSVIALGAGFVIVRHSRAKQAPIDPALLVTVGRRSLNVEILETGRVQPREKVDLKSKVAGQVAAVLVSEGMLVKKGQVLLVLDPVDYERALAKANADVAQAKLALDYAALLRDRAERGAAAGVTSQGELAQMKHDERARTVSLRSAAVTQAIAQDNLRYAKLVSPIDGTVVARGIEPGESVVPGVQSTFEGKALLAVADLTELLVKVNLNQIDVAKVSPGRKATITLDALPGRTYHAVITKVAPASVRLPGKDQDAFPIEARIEAPDALLKPGMTADVRVHLDAKDDVLVVPLEAIVTESGKSYVVRRRPRNESGAGTSKVEVTLGLRSDRDAEVTGGIEEGAQILLRPPSAAENETTL